MAKISKNEPDSLSIGWIGFGIHWACPRPNNQFRMQQPCLQRGGKTVPPLKAGLLHSKVVLKRSLQTQAFDPPRPTGTPPRRGFPRQLPSSEGCRGAAGWVLYSSNTLLIRMQQPCLCEGLVSALCNKQKSRA